MNQGVLSDADFADIVDFRFDVVEIPYVETHVHPGLCPGLTDATQFCNYISDGAILCAEEHSAQWLDFTECIYSTAGADSKNPLNFPDTFDTQLGKCATSMSDFSPTDLRNCAYGDEAAELRRVSAAKWNATHTHVEGQLDVVWVEVAGEEVRMPETPFASHSKWIKNVKAAVCAAYAGPLPAACSGFSGMLV